MSSRRYDSRCSAVQSSGIGVIAKNAFWPLSSGPGDDSIAPPKARRKTGVQLDLERLVGEADQVALAAERLDPGGLLAAEVEQVVGLRVLGGDRRRGRRGRARRSSSGSGPVGAPGRPQVAGQADHLGADRARTRARPRRRIRSGVSVVGAHRVAHLRGEQVAPEAAFAVARRQDDVAQVGLEGGHGRLRAVSAAARRRGISAATAGSSARASAPPRERRRSARRCRPAGAAPSRSGTGRPADRRCPTSVLARGLEDAPAALEPAGDGREPVGQRREFARRCSVNRPSPIR